MKIFTRGMLAGSLLLWNVALIVGIVGVCTDNVATMQSAIGLASGALASAVMAASYLLGCDAYEASL